MTLPYVCYWTHFLQRFAYICSFNCHDNCIVYRTRIRSNTHCSISRHKSKRSIQCSPVKSYLELSLTLCDHEYLSCQVRKKKAKRKWRRDDSRAVAGLLCKISTCYMTWVHSAHIRECNAQKGFVVSIQHSDFYEFLAPNADFINYILWGLHLALFVCSQWTLMCDHSLTNHIYVS